MPIRFDEKVLRAKPFYVSPNFLRVMGIEVLSGQKALSLVRRAASCSTRPLRTSSALKILIGRTVTIDALVLSR